MREDDYRYGKEVFLASALAANTVCIISSFTATYIMLIEALSCILYEDLDEEGAVARRMSELSEEFDDLFINTDVFGSS